MENKQSECEKLIQRFHELSKKEVSPQDYNGVIESPLSTEENQEFQHIKEVLEHECKGFLSAEEKQMLGIEI